MNGLDRRIHARSLTDERAVAVLARGEVACVVRDRSPGGARLVFKSPLELDPAFQLRTGATSRPVEVIWSDKRQAGVRFARCEVVLEHLPLNPARSLRR